MSAPLTAEYLAEVQARVMATTREDWRIERGEFGAVAIGPFSFVEGWDGRTAHPADVEFASKSRRDVPNLLGEVSQLRSAARAAAVILRSVADRVDMRQQANPAMLRHAAADLDRLAGVAPAERVGCDCDAAGHLRCSDYRPPVLAAEEPAPQNPDECTCMPHRKLGCGHCQMDICCDCDCCPCSCKCGSGGRDA